MGKFVDLTGQTFGRLTVLRRAENPRRRGVNWVCECSCGSGIEVIAISHDLTSGEKRSCGCLLDEWRNSKHSDIIGKRFGKLVVTGYSGTKNKCLYFKCKCDCGNDSFVTRKDGLITGHTKSCGCEHGKMGHPNPYKGTGVTYDRAYWVWAKIKARCYNQNCREYPNYGGRGVVMCDEWQDPKAFIEWAYANGYDNSAPKGDCTLDRINVNGNYEPSNCRFVTNLEQQNNKRGNRFLEYNGEVKTIAEWSRRLNIPYPTLYIVWKREESLADFLSGYVPRK